MTTTWTRVRAAVSRLLHRQPGRHRADPLAAVPVLAGAAADAPRPPRAVGVSPAMVTMTDMALVRVAPDIPRQQGRHRYG